MCIALYARRYSYWMTIFVRMILNLSADERYLMCAIFVFHINGYFKISGNEPQPFVENKTTSYVYGIMCERIIT